MDRNFTIEGSKSEYWKSVRLYATDEGKITLGMYGNSFDLACDEIYHMNGMSFLMVYVNSEIKSKFFLSIKTSQEPDIKDYLRYWNASRLGDLKNNKVNSFLSYVNYCLDFIRDNVDVEGLKPTYSTEYVDNTEYGGGILTYFHIYLKCGRDWDDNFKITSALNQQLTSELIDRKFSGEDEYYWFSNMIVQFRPLDDYRENF